MNDIDDIIMGGMVFKSGGGPKKDDDGKVKTKASISPVPTAVVLLVRKRNIANSVRTVNHRRNKNTSRKYQTILC